MSADKMSDFWKKCIGRNDAGREGNGFVDLRRKILRLYDSTISLTGTYFWQKPDIFAYPNTGVSACSSFCP